MIISKCTNQTYCQNSTTIDEVMKSTDITVRMTNYYFDTDDYDNPVKVNIDDDFSWTLLPGYNQENNFRASLNEAEDYTSYFYPFSPDQHKYISVDSVDDKLRVKDDSGTVFELSIIFDRKYIKIERRIYTLFDALGQLGSVISIFVPLGALFVSIFSNKIFNKTMLGIFYDIETAHNNDDGKVHPIYKTEVFDKSRNDKIITTLALNDECKYQDENVTQENKNDN